MTIEENLFKDFTFSEEKLVEFGFDFKDNRFIYIREFPEERFNFILSYDGSKITGKVIDLELNEEYFNYRLENATGFSGQVRQKFIDLLLEVRNQCCVKSTCTSIQANRINNFICETYESRPEFLWSNSPSFAVYRNRDSKKWFALIGNIARSKVDKTTDSKEEITFINLKVPKFEITNILKLSGYYPAYHMNKMNWVSIILDDTLSDREIETRINTSFNSVKLSK